MAATRTPTTAEAVWRAGTTGTCGSRHTGCEGRRERMAGRLTRSADEPEKEAQRP